MQKRGKEMKRESGILLSVSSLPSRFGIGCFSKEAYEWIDHLEASGQSYWQILPLGPVSYGDSPYQSFSTYAGNPYFISLDRLIEEGKLTEEECEAENSGEHSDSVDYEKIYRIRYRLLRKAFERSRPEEEAQYQLFLEENGWWLEDYAMFMAVKEACGGKEWTTWEEGLRLRRSEAMEAFRQTHGMDIRFQKYMQYQFLLQWKELKAYANAKGIRIVGDLPIYVAMDSADTWSSPQLFRLDENHMPTAVAGCPPDGFTALGQLWGNPLYRWDYHRETGYAWWIRRLAYSSKLYDVVRIDHFRGFDEYYAIPFGASDARFGHWEKGPGIELFRETERALGKLDVIAEDLGYMTDSVRRLVRESGFPGMKVLEFAFDSRDSGCATDYLPHNYPENCVAYTGTHDNETIAGWFAGITEEEKLLAREYLCDRSTPENELHLSFISLVLRSAARICIIPMQDYLGLGNDSRMNTPSTVGNNWKWRIQKEKMTEEIWERIGSFTRRYGRWNGK